MSASNAAVESPSFFFFFSSPRRRVLLHQTGILQHVCPLAASACVTVLEMLAEVVGPVELLGRVALPELVHLLKVSDPLLPVLVSSVSCLDTTVE